MKTTCHVGVTGPAQPAIARYVHGDGRPSPLNPRRRGLWASTTRRDTNAKVSAPPEN